MTKAVQDVIDRAKAVKNPSTALALDLDEVLSLGDNAKASNTEVKNLKARLLKEGEEPAEKEPKPTVKKEEPYTLEGIKMVGDDWAHKRDNYTKRYATIEACARG